jgi:hypothetical protein
MASVSLIYPRLNGIAVRIERKGGLQVDVCRELLLHRSYDAGAEDCGDWMKMFQQRPSREKGCMTMLVILL